MSAPVEARLPRESYTVGWLCALPLSEQVAAVSMLDEHYRPCELVFPDDNFYKYGSINDHNVVITCLPPGQPGTVSASTMIKSLALNFPNMKIHLFVGIGGGVPRTPPPADPKKDIHLGDVAVGWAEQTGVPAVIQYDLRRDEPNGKGNLLSILDKPNRRLLNALGSLMTDHKLGRTKFPEHLQKIAMFPHPGLENDKLYKADYHHKSGDTCSSCDPKYLVERATRENQDLIFHQGTILSGNSVMKNGRNRDKLARKHFDAICFEMEAAGVMDQIHCLVIRGIADYADSHKNHMWQEYAAATAAAFARQFLYTIQPQAVKAPKEIQRGPLIKMPPTRDKDFTAREDVISEIEKKFESEQRVALAGIGGVGKSHIALEYCFRFREKHPDSSVIWVYSATATRLHEEYKDIATRLGFPRLNDKSITDILELVRGWLSAEDNSNWLMIMDNADFEEGSSSSEDVQEMSSLLRKYIPRACSGQILITSRNQKVANLMVAKADQIIDVKPMNKEDAESLTRKKLPEGTDSKDISDLVCALEDVPLAITQAAAYITRNEMVSVRKYISWFREGDESRAQLLGKDVKDIESPQGNEDAPRTVLETWQLSFDQIQRTMPNSAELLSLMCFLDPQKIPAFLLSEHANSMEFADIMTPLIEFSFVSLVKETEEENFQMHQLVQIAMRKWLRSNKKFETWQGKALKLICDRFLNGEYKNRKEWRECGILAPHTQWILRDDMKLLKTESREVIKLHASLLRNFAAYTWRQGQYDSSCKKSEESLEFHERFLKEDPVLVLESRALRGLVLNSIGRHSEAMEVHRQVLDDRKRILGKQHPDTLKSMNDLGQALRSQGKYYDAKTMHQQALEERKKVLPIDEYTLTSMNDLAGVLADLRKYSDAEKMYETTLKEKELLLGGEHPSTLVTMLHLAEVLVDQRKYKEAEKTYQKVLALYHLVLGEKHPDTLWAMNGLAVLLERDGKLEDAEKKFQETLDLCEEVLKIDNAHTPVLMGNLAYVLEKQQKYAKAENLYRKALERMKKLPEEVHPDICETTERLEMLLRSQGKEEEANEIRDQLKLLEKSATSRMWGRGGLVSRLVQYVYGT